MLPAGHQKLRQSMSPRSYLEYSPNEVGIHTALVFQ